MTGEAGVIAGNLEALAKRDPRLAGRLANATVEVRGLEIAASATGRPFLRLVLGDERRDLESARDPGGEARDCVAHLPRGTRLLVVKGCGLGYVLKAAVANRSLERILCVEPRLALFVLMLHASDMRRVIADPRVEFLVEGEPREAAERLKKACDHGTDPSALLVVLPPFALLRHPAMAVSPAFEKEFDAAWSEVAVLSERNRRTLETFLDPWRENILANLTAVIASGAARDLEGAARGRPGVLVGAGPSLDRNVAALAKARGRAVVVAVDTAYRTLKAAGVVPDLVVAVDATEENVRDFDGVTVGDDPTALVMVPVVHPAIPPLFTRRFCAGYGHPLQVWIERKLGRDYGSLLVSGSVSTISFDLLRRMGADPVILCGVDLAVGRSSHTRGRMGMDGLTRFASGEARARRSVSDAGIARPGWGGVEARTNEQMLRWAAWFEKEIGRGRPRVVNATEGGLRMQGASEMPLAEALERFTPRSAFALPAPRPASASGIAALREGMERFVADASYRREESAWILKWDAALRDARCLEELREDLRAGFARTLERTPG